MFKLLKRYENLINERLNEFLFFATNEKGVIVVHSGYNFIFMRNLLVIN